MGTSSDERHDDSPQAPLSPPDLIPSGRGRSLCRSFKPQRKGMGFERRPPGGARWPVLLAAAVEEVEIRLRVSAGANLDLALSGQERADLTEVAQPNPVFWSFTTPIISGEETRTYVLRNARGTPLSRCRHIFIRPTDAAGARFEIESLRIVSRKGAPGRGPLGDRMAGTLGVLSRDDRGADAGDGPRLPDPSRKPVARPRGRHSRGRARDLPGGGRQAGSRSRAP